MKIPGLVFATAWLVAGSCLAETPRHPHVEGLSGSVDFDYDGSRARTDVFHLGAEVEWGSSRDWITFAVDTYSDLNRRWSAKDDTFFNVTFGHALLRDHDARLYINATLDVDIPSLLASRGVDLTPEINIAKGLTEDWWIGGSLNAVFSTAPDEGNRTGYGSCNLWLYWASGWLPNATDTFTLSLWAATNEVPGDDNALFFSLEYAFDITDDLEATLGIGTDPISPWDHLGVYGIAGLKWRF